MATIPQGFSFEIPCASVNGPLSLRDTLLSGQTGQPEWLAVDGSFTDVRVLDGTPVKYALQQVGDRDNFRIRVHVTAINPEEAATNLKDHLSRMLGLKDDLNCFYQKFANEDPALAHTFINLRGLRLMRGPDLFEALICSMLSQNNSVRLLNRSARLMMQHFGRIVSFPDGSKESLFPQAETLARLNSRELRLKTSTGYRAKPIVNVSRKIANGELSLGKLAEDSYDHAVETLLELPGVGPKVADCFLLYGGIHTEAAPVDLWIHRIVLKLYFRGKKVSRLKTARFLRERFLNWAGYAQLYLFDYARRGKVAPT